MSTWSNRHHVEVEEADIDPAELFDARHEGWSKFDFLAEDDFIDDEDEYPHGRG
jgi:hypothetical protein